MRTKQEWKLGEVVRVGFLTGFLIVGKIPTPGDHRPDKWVLVRNGITYHFTPHNGGLERIG